MKKVLVTGASGFLGWHCLRPLLDRGFEVHALARTVPSEGSMPSITWHAGDFLSESTPGVVLERVNPHFFLHLAWDVTPGLYWESSSNLRWLQASSRWAAEFKRRGGKRWVSAGTCAEYEWNNRECDESGPLKPATLYGKSKLEMHNALNTLFGSSVSHSWGRIFFAYGPREKPQRLIPGAILSCLEGRVFQCDHGYQQRDFIYVEDLGAIFAALLDSGVEGPMNLGSGDRRSLKQVLGEIENQLGREQWIRYGQEREKVVEFLFPKLERMKNELHWEPASTLETGLEKTIQWWRLQKKQR